MNEKSTVEALQQKIATLEKQLETSRQNDLSSGGSEEKWRSILHNVPNHLILFDLQGKVLFINRVAPNVTIDEVVGKNVFNFISVDYQDKLRTCCSGYHEVDIIIMIGIERCESHRVYHSLGDSVFRVREIIGSLVVNSEFVDPGTSAHHIGYAVQTTVRGAEREVLDADRGVLGR